MGEDLMDKSLALLVILASNNTEHLS